MSEWWRAGTFVAAIACAFLAAYLFAEKGAPIYRRADGAWIIASAGVTLAGVALLIVTVTW